eukprot:4382762-Pleurochrysis_carterae.AAC.1
MRGEHSQGVRERCASLVCKESNVSGGALIRSAGHFARGDRIKVREAEKPPRRCEKNKVVRLGMGEGARKQGELDGAGGVCARASVAT